MELLLWLAIGLGAWFAWRAFRGNVHGAKTTSKREDEVLLQIERRMWEHWKEARDGDTPETIARLVRDDLQNARVKDPLAYKWATPETAGRVFRNFERELRSVVAAEMARTGAEPEPAEPAALPPRSEDTEEEPVVRLKTCRQCATKNRGDAYKCSRCGDVFPKPSRKVSRMPDANDIAANRCGACGTTHAAGKYRCRKCGGWLPAARE